MPTDPRLQALNPTSQVSSTYRTLCRLIVLIWLSFVQPIFLWNDVKGWWWWWWWCKSLMFPRICKWFSKDVLSPPEHCLNVTKILVSALGSSAGYPGAPPPSYGFQSDYSSGRQHYPRQHNGTPGTGGGSFWTGLGTGGALGYLFGSQRLVEGYWQNTYTSHIYEGYHFPDLIALYRYLLFSFSLIWLDWYMFGELRASVWLCSFPNYTSQLWLSIWLSDFIGVPWINKTPNRTVWWLSKGKAHQSTWKGQHGCGWGKRRPFMGQVHFITIALNHSWYQRSHCGCYHGSQMYVSKLV